MKIIFYPMLLFPMCAVGQASLSTYWAKIGGWDVSNCTIYNPKDIQTPIPTDRVVEFSAFIYSNPDANGNIFVDRFDKKSAFSTSLAKYQGRGGFIQIRNSSSNTATVHMEGGVANGINGQQQIAGHFMQGYHTGTVGNRGWIKLVYTGSPVSDAPYAIKSKIVPINGWDMTIPDTTEGGCNCKKMTWSSFGVNVNRVGFFQATIFSNPFASPFAMDGISDLHKKSVGSTMPIFSNGVPSGEGANNGGIATIDQQRDLVQLENLYNSTSGYFGSGHTGTSSNRGMFRIDYLGGSCEQGGSGFLIKAIPSNAVNNCATASGNLVIEGAGSDIWNNNDEFTFVYKSYADNSGHTQNRSFSAKVESQGNSNGWAKTGVMVRVGTGAGSAEVSMLATPSNGVQWTNRTSDGGSTTHPAVTASTVKAPIWVRIVKTGTSYVGSYSSNGTTWTQLGSAVTIATGTTYYAGLAATSMSSSMNNSTFSNLGF